METGLKSIEVTVSLVSSSSSFVPTSSARRLRFLDEVSLSSFLAWSDQLIEDDDLLVRLVCVRLCKIGDDATLQSCLMNLCLFLSCNG